MKNLRVVAKLPIKVLAFMSSQFDRLPSKLKVSYYLGSSFILNLLRADIVEIAKDSNNAYIEASLSFFVINTLQYLVIKLGDYANTKK